MCDKLETVFKASKSEQMLPSFLHLFTSTQLMFYIILLYLIYCVEVCGNASKYILDPVIQKRILRIITYSSCRAHTDVLFKSLNILSFNILVMHRIGIFMHKIHLNKSSECISNMFTSRKEIHNHNTRQKLHLHIKRRNHEYVYRSFIYQGVYI